MKRTLLILLILLGTLDQAGAYTIYFTDSQMPDLTVILPGPPDSTSMDFARDMNKYMAGKAMRHTERGRLAAAHSGYNISMVTTYFSEPYGMTISNETTPALYFLLESTLVTGEVAMGRIKRYYKRQRPCLRYKEPTGSGEVFPETSYSYPSGHTIRGWLTAMVLAEINPAVRNQVFALAQEYCENRVIVGAHWQSDVDASRTAASIGFCALQGSEEFIAQMKKAQQEYKEKTGQATAIGAAATAPASAHSARIYNINGTPATQSAQGIVIQNGHKTLRN